MNSGVKFPIPRIFWVPTGVLAAWNITADQQGKRFLHAFAHKKRNPFNENCLDLYLQGESDSASGICMSVQYRFIYLVLFSAQDTHMGVDYKNNQEMGSIFTIAGNNSL